jgi:hypothetical protein
MKRTARLFLWFLVIFAILPSAVGAAIGFTRGWPSNWRAASWASAGVLPKAIEQREAEVVILSARTGRWKGIFAEHMAIVVKPKNAVGWTRYEVVGWGEPVRQDAFVPDAMWYGNTPRIIFDVKGPKAEALIPEIEKAVANYPHSQRGSYTVWPGPNSNTFVAWIVRNTDGFAVELPPEAVGKDWLGTFGVAAAPSKTGYTVSLAGLLGGTLAWDEGAELHFLGSTIGIDVNDLAIKLPALGKLSAASTFASSQ